MDRRKARRAPRAAVRPAPTTSEPGRTWFRFENFVRPDTTAIYLFDEIGYWGVLASDFVRELATVSAPNVELHINSPGGDVFEALAIYNALRQHPANIVVMIDGLAASAASFIAQAGDRVVIARNATMMIHEASGLCAGNSADMQQMAEVLDGISANIADVYAQRSGRPVEEWRNLMRAETWYHNGADAVAAGLADEVDEEQDVEDDVAEPGDALAAQLDRLRPAARANVPALLPPPARPAAVLPGPAAGAVEVPPPSPSGQAAGGGTVVNIRVAGSIRGEADIAEAIRAALTSSSGRAKSGPIERAEDSWADQVAHLLTPPEDDWAARTAGLLTPATEALQ
ncbi:hypothetical protein Aph01nite_13220 [Acrocarpospora phusangensis]|uniref:ATP-dependent Clp protease proteolytic subunit n=1 Tax=Acrocarpospora phusangensis TaxID=1070424 RepID=A0A919UM73_9ACTN|nr:head maturation protease, ClpP-related [Acrocarpospora phusangensis]GIH23012.1 hypothetical protein Aph01nite_13220 [Acrocarpospora phusangensis]